MKYFIISYILGIISIYFASRVDKKDGKEQLSLFLSIMGISLGIGFFILGIQSGDDWYEIPLFTGIAGTAIFFLFKDFYERLTGSIKTSEKLNILCPVLKENKKKR